MQLAFVAVVKMGNILLELVFLVLAVCSAAIEGGGQAADTAGSKLSARSELPYFFQAERLVRQTTKQAESGQPKTRGRRHIRVVTIEAPPFMMKGKPIEEQHDPAGHQNGADERQKRDQTESTTSNGQQEEWHGYCMDFFRELLKYLPYELSYEIYEVPDKRFGSKTREISLEKTNSSGAGSAKSHQKFVRRERWNGLIGELASGRAQLALAPMSVMAERELVVDFTVPFYDLVGIQILLKRPEVPRDWFKFLTVLDNEVWLSITTAYFITSLIIYLFDRLSPYSHKNMKRVERIRAKRRQVRSAHRFQPNWSHLPSGGQSNLSRTGLAIDTISSLNPIAPLGELPYSERIPLAAPRRRLSQDYLQSLRLQTSDLMNISTPGGQPAKTNREDLNQARTDSDSDSSLEDGRPDFNLRDSLWFCITSLTPQGGGEAPQNLSGRVVAGAWWLFCFIVIASYTANLAAFLTVSRLDIPIESLDDLAKQYRIKYAPIEGTAEQSFFERMAYIEEIFYNIWKEMSLNDSLSEEERSKFAIWDYPISDKYTKIWSQIQEAQMPNNLSQAIARVKASTLEDGFALLGNANVIRYATMTDCQFRAVGEEFSRKPIALALQKNQDEIRNDLSYAILQLINRRYMEVLREKWWTNNPNRLVCDLNDESEGISIENIGGVFIIIIIGVLLSFLVWALERLLYATKLEVSREKLMAGHNPAPKSS